MSTEREAQTREAVKGLQTLAPPVLSPGVPGRSHRDDPRLTSWARHFATDHAVGCALAHHNVAQRLLADGHEAALVLEDDVWVADVQRCDSLLLWASLQDADLVLLNCCGLCWPGSHGKASGAAYLLFRSGARQVVQSRVSFHVDWTRNVQSYRVLVVPDAFLTRDAASPLSLGGRSLSFYMKQSAIRLAGWDLSLAQLLLLDALMILGLLGLWRLGGVPGVAVSNLLLGFMTWQLALPFFFAYDVGFMRLSPCARCTILLLALLVLLQQLGAPPRGGQWATVALAYFVLAYQVLDLANSSGDLSSRRS